ncbi:MAG: type II secretion system protein GspG [bacterium]|nr:type II secretion system protein GspG [bacterium]
MTTQLLQLIISSIIGTTFIVNGVVLKTDDILAAATESVNGANIHQIATVLEMYYMDNGEYPAVSGGEELIDLFEKESRIRNRPLDPNVFSYHITENGQDYKLEITK